MQSVTPPYETPDESAEGRETRGKAHSNTRYQRPQQRLRSHEVRVHADNCTYELPHPLVNVGPEL